MTPEELLEQGMPIARRLAQDWNLRLLEPLTGANNCLVLGVEGERVLRIPLVGEERLEGFEAMRAFSRQGGVSVLRADPLTGSVLMPRLRPGSPLSEAGLSIEGEAAALCAVFRRLPDVCFDVAIPVEKWYAPFLRVIHAEGIPDALLREAQVSAEGLLATSLKSRLIHGDLHHFNILRDGEEWVAIDPKGLLAEPAVETAAFLRNPPGAVMASTDPVQLLERRIQALAEGLGLDAARIRDWGIAHNVLSAWWDAPEDREPTLSIVEALRAVRL